LSQFSSPHIKLCLRHRHALEAYLSCPSKKSLCDLLKLLFNAAKKIWEQEGALAEFGADVPKSFCATTYGKDVEALHEILSQKGLESVEQDFQCQVWKSF